MFMKKIFPIKVEKANPFNYKFIEWKIHNVCNYNCSFCGSEHKNGSSKWFSLDEYKKHIDKLIDACNGDPVWVQITGGEPTLYPKLISLLDHIKSKGAMVSLISNGSRTIRWWKELKEKKVLDHLYLTYHSEQTDNYQHITEVANLFHDEPLEVTCLITHVYSTMNQAVEAQQYIFENTGATISLKAMNIGTYDIYLMYTKEQLDNLKSKSIVLGKLSDTKAKSSIDDQYKLKYALQITNNDNTILLTNSQTLMKEQKNRFFGWDCSIGESTMRIDYDIIYRGVCGEGEKRSIYDDTISFTDNYITCKQPHCFCGTDLVATKILPENKYPTE